jgi:hypothetical protein
MKKVYIGTIYKAYNRGRIAPKPWSSRVGVSNGYVNVGCFETEREAAIARDKYIIKNKLSNKLNILKKVVVTEK